MITLTRINGKEFALNADLIIRLEATPDTLVTLIEGSKYVVAESVDEVIDRIISFRARVVGRAETVDTSSSDSGLRLVPARTGSVVAPDFSIDEEDS